MKNRLFLIYLLNLIFLSSHAQEQDLFGYSNSVKFANYLYSSHEYDLAIPEFKRILFIDSLNTLANIKIHDCYIQAGKYTEGIKFSNHEFHKLYDNDTLSILRGKLMILTDNYPQLNSEILSNPLSSQGLVFLQMSESMFNKEWDKASGYLPFIENYNGLQQFVPIMKKASNIQYKNPALSFSMSAIVPGSGKVYSGYWKDGLFSFLFVGITAWQSYRGFDDKGIQSIYGWLMGGISFSFYAGNLYGSVKAANKKNFEMENLILKEYEEAFISTYSNF